MAAHTTHPNSIRMDLDPYEQMTKVLENPMFKPNLSMVNEISDLLTKDIEQQLDEHGKSVWVDEEWLEGSKKEVNQIMDELNIDKEKYDFLAGHESWTQDIFAVPVELRIKESNLLTKVSEPGIYRSWKRAIKHMYECAEKGATVKPDEGSKEKKVMLLMNALGSGYNCDHLQLMAHCSMGEFWVVIGMIEMNKDDFNSSRVPLTADVRFAKLLTTLELWKENEFDEVDTKEVFSIYVLALMLIHFLQVGCQPPVLPPLRDLGVAEKTYGKYTVSNCDIKFESKNKKSLGNLFNFFNYFETPLSGGFDFENWKISVREGTVIKLEQPSKCYFIEDPLKYGSLNAVDESKCPGISNILAVMFMQSRVRLMKERRL